MKRTRYHFALATLALLAVCAATAAATPAINGAVVQSRIFNDCPASLFSSSKVYPGILHLTDDNTGCSAYTNLHNWRLSSDGGATPAVFNNGDCFRIAATLTLRHTGLQVEGGLQVSPWWSQNVDGRLQVRLTDGVIEGWGGVLPAYNFTANFGITYVEGEPIRLEMIYLPHSNTNADPGTMEYRVTWRGIGYTSGPLPMLNCNVAEEPFAGCWGILNNARVGGWMQGPGNYLGHSGGSGVSDALWTGIDFEEICPVPTLPATMGRVKAAYR
jgi:hypothetical protein